MNYSTPQNRPRASVAQRVYTAPDRNAHPTAHTVPAETAPAPLMPSLQVPS